MNTDPNAANAVRMDLMEVYDRLTRYTSLRARMLVLSNNESAQAMTILQSDYQTVNPLIKLALAEVSDQIGALVDFRTDGLDALSHHGLEDWKMKISGMSSEGQEGSQDLAHIIALYNLPGDTMQAGYVPAIHEFIYEAITSHVLMSWFRHLGLLDVANMYQYEFGVKLGQAKYAAPLWNNKRKARRRPVNL